MAVAFRCIEHFMVVWIWLEPGRLMGTAGDSI
jgi:hypothetical protein